MTLTIEDLKKVCEARVKLLKIKSWDTPDKFSYLYAGTDGRGNYTLANNGSVWVTDDPKNQFLQEVDGKPHCKEKDSDYWVWEVNGKLGVYDDNLKMIYGPYKDTDEIIDDSREDEELYELVSQAWNL